MNINEEAFAYSWAKWASVSRLTVMGYIYFGRVDGQPNLTVLTWFIPGSSRSHALAMHLG